MLWGGEPLGAARPFSLAIPVVRRQHEMIVSKLIPRMSGKPAESRIKITSIHISFASAPHHRKRFAEGPVSGTLAACTAP
jgi:hypothetical protein